MGNVSEDEPTSVEHSLRMNDRANWINAMVDELKSLPDNEMFDVENKPKERKIIPCRWVYALKENSKGEVVRHKARVVVESYPQVYGVEYHDAFAPVVRWDTVRFFFPYAAENNFELKQIDAKTASLNGSLREDIYMKLPSLPDDVLENLMMKHENIATVKSLCTAAKRIDGCMVLKLLKSIYGLKQAAKQRWMKLSSTLPRHGLR